MTGPRPSQWLRTHRPRHWWILISWPPEGDDMTRYVSLDGMPSRGELLKHYEKISGRPTDDIDYYVVLARWKLGIVLELSVAKFASGGAVDPKVASGR